MAGLDGNCLQGGGHHWLFSRVLPGGLTVEWIDMAPPGCSSKRKSCPGHALVQTLFPGEKRIWAWDFNFKPTSKSKPQERKSHGANTSGTRNRQDTVLFHHCPRGNLTRIRPSPKQRKFKKAVVCAARFPQNATHGS